MSRAHEIFPIGPFIRSKGIRGGCLDVATFYALGDTFVLHNIKVIERRLCII